MEDLRAWMRKVETMGELRKIDGADWDLEIGAILSPRVCGKDSSAFLFNHIKDYPEGFRILTRPLKSASRVALSFHLPQVGENELVKILRHKIPQWEAELSNFPPRIVGSGPVLENIRSGREVNLFEFPVPKWHEHDGGRYFGTADAVITRDPDTGEINLGTYRIAVHDEKTAGLFCVPGHHGMLHYQKYHDRGQACPVAVVCGDHPLFFGIGSLPVNGPEYNWIGAIDGHPVDVIEEEVTGLPIPTNSEIVIVGWCPPGKTRVEGPFGEWTGHYGGSEMPAPIIEIERVYFRNKPIMLGSCPGRPPSDHACMRGAFRSAELHNELEKAGISDIQGVWLSDAAERMFIIISLKQRYPGHARRAGLMAAQTEVAAFMGRYVVVVDEDIDPTNMDDVVWAMAFRSDPEKDIDIIRGTAGSRLDPIIRKTASSFTTSRAIIDACKPFDWIDEFPKVVDLSPGLLEKARKKWST
ncbi:MAG: UbiD family decarboxylase [Desulfobacterales bacterium]|nr:UbiD family decarboxylase [Desulfobacterales bacterium]